LRWKKCAKDADTGWTVDILCDQINGVPTTGAE
jgi:hypothetical protein